MTSGGPGDWESSARDEAGPAPGQEQQALSTNASDSESFQLATDLFLASASRETPASTSTHRRIRRPLAAGAAIAVAAGVVAGVLAATGSPPASPRQIVLDAAVFAEQQHTADVTMSLSSAGLPNDSQLSGTGTGKANFDTGAMSASYSYSGLPNVEGLDLKMLYVGDTLYMDVEQSGQDISALLPGKHWIEESISQSAQESSGASLGNPTAMLNALAANGNTVMPIGSSTINGISVSGYKVTVNKAAAQQRINSSNLPSVVKQGAESFLAAGNIRIDVWVNGNDLVRMGFAMNFPSVPDATITMNEDFSNYGVPVSITAPNPSLVVTLQQFLSAAQAAGNGQ